ncbi:YhcN/YlaJ family sporulation lipoprotein [Psychrobacillus antarcticus]|uniref:YhcN/YlaJ family sporulation lipoprotein n=1 Tax=Psychrobacillus antarcticus TaxID=2879115 RepID=UPI0024083ADD|nr:YhcN/YlaJ family sporulation lipoprotein [Psychrobacillus antarcticus]
MKQLLKIIFVMLLIGLLTACGTNNKEDVVTDTGTGKVVEEKGTINEDIRNDTTTGNNTTTGNGTVTGTEGRKVEVADDVAAKITQIEGVKAASVLVTDNNAYVAVDLKEGVNETEELKTKISDAAKAENAAFNNVYVSSNPDFTLQFKEYGERVRAGEPVEGFFDEFTDTVKRVFPDHAK